jgi:multidrug transporter EmrE-like cation transporter
MNASGELSANGSWIKHQLYLLQSYLVKILIYTIPVAILVAYSQIIVKWRAVDLNVAAEVEPKLISKLLAYLLDPYILSGYIAALLGSFVWLFIVGKLPLAVAFPIYIGLTFLFVIVGSFVLLNEPMTNGKIISGFLILLGVIIGSRA